MKIRPTLLLLLLVVISGASGCESGAEPSLTRDYFLDIQPRPLNIRENVVASLSIQVIDSRGNPVGGNFTPVLQSRDTTVARIVGGTAVEARSVGSTRVVVSVRVGNTTISDSIQVFVARPG
ncbi:MAG: hypothetical protein ACT4P6_15410 [Gemmatimonadaceae bacterium]